MVFGSLKGISGSIFLRSEMIPLW